LPPWYASVAYPHTVSRVAVIDFADRKPSTKLVALVSNSAARAARKVEERPEKYGRVEAKVTLNVT